MGLVTVQHDLSHYHVKHVTLCVVTNATDMLHACLNLSRSVIHFAFYNCIYKLQKRRELKMRNSVVYLAVRAALRLM